MKTRIPLRFRLLLAAMIAAPATAPVPAQAQAGLTDADRSAIQGIVNDYARFLGECRSGDYADLFAPGTGYFASGFRGHMQGREQLIELVESERHCTARQGSTPAQRPGSGTGPTVEIRVDNGVVRGLANLATAEYQDEYVKMPQGWRFASRTVILATEKEAGLDAAALLAIHRLGGDDLGNNYVPDANGVERLLNSGVAVSVADGVVSGRAYLKSGGYRDEVYAKAASGEWRVVSSTFVPE